MARILIVDDEEQIRKLISRMLERKGYEVFAALDGREAVAMNRDLRCDLAVVDLIMPNKDGYDTIHELKRHCPTLKVIAMSGGNRRRRILPEAYLRFAGELGADRMFTKPVEKDTLLDAVEALLG